MRLERHCILPSQTVPSRPEHWLYDLCEKLLEDAQRLLMEGKRKQERLRGRGTRALRLDIRETLEWIQATEAANRYDCLTFVAVCELLNRDPDRTRKAIMQFWHSDTKCDYSQTEDQLKENLFEYIEIHPGAPMTHIHKAIRGGTAKHLKLIMELTAEGRVIRVKEGNFWCVYPVGEYTETAA